MSVLLYVFGSDICLFGATGISNRQEGDDDDRGGGSQNDAYALYNVTLVRCLLLL